MRMAQKPVAKAVECAEVRSASLANDALHVVQHTLRHYIATCLIKNKKHLKKGVFAIIRQNSGELYACRLPPLLEKSHHYVQQRDERDGQGFVLSMH